MPNHTPPPTRDWPTYAACQGTSTALFFGTTDRYDVDRYDRHTLARAKAICRRCPVREECLAAAVAHGTDACGVWGETTEEERAQLRRHIPRVKCPVCAGTALRPDTGMQVCGGCGHSWTTMTPAAQARARARSFDQVLANADPAGVAA